MAFVSREENSEMTTYACSRTNSQNHGGRIAAAVAVHLVAHSAVMRPSRRQWAAVREPVGAGGPEETRAPWRGLLRSLRREVVESACFNFNPGKILDERRVGMTMIV